MATSSNSVEFKLVGRDQTKAAIDQAIRNLESMGKKANSVDVSLKSLGRAWVTFNAVGKAFEGVKAIADFSVSVERAEAGFTVLLGSATAAEERIRSITKFAAETPFEMAGVVELNRMLQSLTDGALATAEGMQLVGDAASVSSQPLELVGMWIGRLYAGLESGTPVGEATLRLVEMGLVSGTVKRELDALAVSGALPANEAMAKLQETLGFATGAMALQSETVSGLVAKIKDFAVIAIARSDEVVAVFSKTRDVLRDINMILEFGAKAEEKRVESMKSAHLSALAELQIAWGNGKISQLELQAATIALNQELGRGTVETLKATAASFLNLNSSLQATTQGFKDQAQVLAENNDLWQSTYDLSKKMGDAMLDPAERQHQQVIQNTVALTEQAEKLFQLGAIGSQAYDELTRKAFEYYESQTGKLFAGPAFESGGMGQFTEEDAFVANIEASLERAKELQGEYQQWEMDNILTMREAEIIAHDERLEEIRALAIEKAEVNSLIAQEQIMHSQRMIQIEKNEQEQRQRIQRMNVRYAQATFANLANAAATFMGEGSAAYKAFASVEATIATYLAANKAFAEVPYPFNFVASAAVIAAGLANVAKINGAGGGGRAHSGATNIPSEGTYLLNRGERVLAPEQNRDLTDALERGGMGGGAIQIIFDGEILAQTINQMASDGRLTIPARAVA